MLSVILVCMLVSLGQGCHGKKPGAGGWNRPFLGGNNTVDDYIQQLMWRAGNYTQQKGLQFQPANYQFQINDVLLGLRFEGSVFFESGVLLNEGQLQKSDFAIIVNRSADLSTASILFSAGIDQISTSHTLRTELRENNADGSVETTLKNIDFILELNHTFSTGINTIQMNSLVILDEDATYKILPRNTATYAIETLSKRSNITSVWYEEALARWQQQKLVPLLVEQAQALPFPISPY